MQLIIDATQTKSFLFGKIPFTCFSNHVPFVILTADKLHSCRGLFFNQALGHPTPDSTPALSKEKYSQKPELGPCLAKTAVLEIGPDAISSTWFHFIYGHDIPFFMHDLICPQLVLDVTIQTPKGPYFHFLLCLLSFSHPLSHLLPISHHFPRLTYHL